MTIRALQYCPAEVREKNGETVCWMGRVKENHFTPPFPYVKLVAIPVQQLNK